MADAAVPAAVATVTARALHVRALFAEWERATYGHEWSAAELMAGLVVDVGDLTRLVMAATGSRRLEDVDRRLGHELADCLWAVLVLADRLGVDLGTAFVDTMDELEATLRQRLAGGA